MGDNQTQVFLCLLLPGHQQSLSEENEGQFGLTGSSQCLSHDGPHSHCRCLKDTCHVLSCSISSELLLKRTGSVMTRDRCVSPWTDGCVSIISRLSHRTECQISNMTGNHGKRGLCLWPHGCTSGRLRCIAQMSPVERWWKSWKGDLWVARGYSCCFSQHLLPCVSPEAALS